MQNNVFYYSFNNMTVILISVTLGKCHGDIIEHLLLKKTVKLNHTERVLPLITHTLFVTD